MGNQLSTFFSSTPKPLPSAVNITATQIIDACGQPTLLDSWLAESNGKHLTLLVGTRVNIFRYVQHPPPSRAPYPTQPTFSATISGIVDRTAKNTHFLVYDSDFEESSFLIIPLSRTTKISWRKKLSLLLSKLRGPAPAPTSEDFALSPIHRHILQLVNTSSRNADSVISEVDEEAHPKCSI